MNASILTGDYLIAGIYAYIGYRNLHFAYKSNEIYSTGGETVQEVRLISPLEIVFAFPFSS